MQFPCAGCGAARQSLEAACDNCGWSPEPMTTPGSYSGDADARGTNWRIWAFLAICPVALAALIWIARSRGLDAPPQLNVSPISTEIFVQDSQPVAPGTIVDVVTTSKPRQLVLGNAQVTDARWEFPDPIQTPAYPARGFITLQLSDDQVNIIQSAGDISIFPAGDWEPE